MSDKKKSNSVPLENVDTMIYTYRYMFSRDDAPNKICVRYVSDVMVGHDTLVDELKKDPSIIRCGREYVSSYDVVKIGIFETLKQDNEESEVK